MSAQTDIHKDFALAVDIGGTKVAFALVDTAGNLLTPITQHPVPFDPQGVADPQKLVERMRPYVEQAHSAPGRFVGIGLSVCGNLDNDTGMVALSPNLHWRYVPFGQMVKDAFHMPIAAATDVRMALLAEVLWGAARGLKYVLWATIGTGFGGYLFLDGKLYGGTHGYAGNFGHLTLDEVNGSMCGCGKPGCFETFVAGPAIARHGQQAADSGASPYLQQIARERAITTADVFAAEAAGDPAAHQIIEETIRLIAINMAGVVTLLDLDMIVFGGGVVRASPDFFPRIQRRIPDFLMTAEAKRDLQVVTETYENSALVGAAASVFLRCKVLPEPESSRVLIEGEE